MKRVFFITLFLLLCLILCATAVNGQEDDDTVVHYKADEVAYASLSDFGNTLLHMIPYNEKGALMGVSDFKGDFYLTYRKASQDEAQARTIYFPDVEVRNTHSHYFDIQKWGFVPEVGEAYLISFRTVNEQKKLVYQSNTVTLTADTSLRFTQDAPSAAALQITPYQNGFNLLPVEGVGVMPVLSFSLYQGKKQVTLKANLTACIEMTGLPLTEALPVHADKEHEGVYHIYLCDDMGQPYLSPQKNTGYGFGISFYNNGVLYYTAVCEETIAAFHECKPDPDPFYLNGSEAKLMNVKIEGEEITCFHMQTWGFDAAYGVNFARFTWYADVFDAEGRMDTYQVSPMFSGRNMFMRTAGHGFFPVKGHTYMMRLYAENEWGVSVAKTATSIQFTCNFDMILSDNRVQNMKIELTPGDPAFPDAYTVVTAVSGVKLTENDRVYIRINRKKYSTVNPKYSISTVTSPVLLEDGSYAFALPRDTAFSPEDGEALTLTLAYYSEKYQRLYISEVTGGYDYYAKSENIVEPILPPQGSENIVEPILPPQGSGVQKLPENEKRAPKVAYLIVYGVCAAAVVIAVVVIVYDRRSGRKRK